MLLRTRDLQEADGGSMQGRCGADGGACGADGGPCGAGLPDGISALEGGRDNTLLPPEVTSSQRQIRTLVENRRLLFYNKTVKAFLFYSEDYVLINVLCFKNSLISTGRQKLFVPGN